MKLIGVFQYFAGGDTVFPGKPVAITQDGSAGICHVAVEEGPSHRLFGVHAGDATYAGECLGIVLTHSRAPQAIYVRLA